MLLAGDIGGTKTLLGLFEPRAGRPRPLAVRAFATFEFESLTSLIGAFASDEDVKGAPLDVACFGVAGPVIGDTAELTNVPWRIDASEVGTTFDIRRVALLNDLQAMAYAVPILEGPELLTLQEGKAVRGGNMAVIAAGTGMGQALLHNVGGRFVPSPCEGGHADFSARTEPEIALLRDLIRRFGRATVEHVVSGPGLVNIHRVMHEGPCSVEVDPDDPDAPAAISTAALEGRCQGCVEVLGIFLEAYGAEAGNLALRSVATAGLFVGGGIAPKILSALADGRFIRAFRDKAPLHDLLSQVPVKIILNSEAALLGAAVYAAGV